MSQRPSKSSKSGSLSTRKRTTAPPPEPPGYAERVKSWLPGSAGQRRISRKAREDKRTRWLYLAIAATAVSVLALLVGGALNDYYFIPNKVLATVEGTEIKREEYWKVRSHNLISQSSQYQQIANFVEGEQQTQYLTLAEQALIDLEDTWGSTDTDPATLQQMIDDQVYLKALETSGNPVTQADIDQYVTQQFQPADSPIVTAAPTPTLIPERAAWATQTAVAMAATPLLEGSPVPASSPVAIESTPQPASPAAVESTPQPGSPAAASSPVAVESTPDAASTPELSVSDAIATTEASYEAYGDQVFPQAHMSESDYEQMIIAPAVARERVRNQINEEVGQSADQVHASHILVGTSELADSIHQDLVDGADFGEVAMQQSTDTATAPTGGDLGWFPHGVMVPEFDAVAFETPPGEFSQPFQTEFGWHIVLVAEAEANRALTDEQMTQVQESRLVAWEEETRQGMDISSDIPPSPTPFPESFVPPPGAPSPPPPTAIPATPEGVVPADAAPASSSASPVAGTPVP